MTISYESRARIGAVTCALTLALCLTACGGGTSASSSSIGTQSSDTSAQATDVTSASESTSATKDAENASTTSDTSSERVGATSSVADTSATKDSKHILTLDEAKQMFSCTIDGTKYELPSNVSDLLNAGWKYKAVNSMEEDTVLEPGKGYGNLILTLGELDKYGNTDKKIQIDFLNLSDQTIPWQESTLTGVRYSVDSDGLAKWNEPSAANDLVSFVSGTGINIGDSIDAVKSQYGIWNSVSGDEAKSSETFNMYLGDQSDSKLLGFISFSQIDGKINSIYISLAGNSIEMMQ